MLATVIRRRRIEPAGEPRKDWFSDEPVVISTPDGDPATAATAAIDAEAARLHRDDPDVRAFGWHHDVHIAIYELPDDTDLDYLFDHRPQPLAERLILGGHHLTATRWWQDYENARSAYITDTTRRAPVLRFGAAAARSGNDAWHASAIRSVLLQRRPDTIDGTIEFDAQQPLPFPGEDPPPMRYYDHAEQPAFNQILDEVRATSRTANTGGRDMSAFTRVLAEFLTGTEFARRDWWRPAKDPEPGDHVNRVFDGANHYHREEGTWYLDGTSEKTGLPTWGEYAWADIPAPLLVNSTQPLAGTYKTGAPAGSTIADWQATTPDEAATLIRAALQELLDRTAAGTANGTIATRWTPSEGGPIILLQVGTLDEQESPASTHSDNKVRQ